MAKKRNLILANMNAARKACGVDTVVMDPKLTKGCNLHARYLNLNLNHPKTAGLLAHEEYPELKGYTKEGQAAGKNSVIEPGREDNEVADWVPSFYHRVVILDPSLATVGIGLNIKDGITTSLINIYDGATKETTVSVVCYPGSGQKNIPLKMRTEYPNPTPLPNSGECGFPITITFTKGQTITQAKFTLTNAAGQPVDCFVSSPEKPACSQSQMNTICGIPKKSLKPNTSYTVTVSCKMDGKSFKKIYKFQTGTKVN